MKLLDAVDTVHDAFARTVISSDYPAKFKGDVIQALDVFEENSALLTNSNEYSAFYRAIVLYIFDEARPDILPKLVAVLSHAHAGNRRHQSNTIEDYCILTNQELHPDEWPLHTRIAHYEEKGDINLIQGGIFYKRQLKSKSPNKHQIRYTGKAAYQKAKSLAEQSFDTDIKPSILAEIVSKYDEIEKKFQDISDNFFYRD